MMNGQGKSYSSIVPEKPTNEVERAQARTAEETVEERELAKENSHERTALRTQSRGGVSSALARVRHAVENVRYAGSI